jgi:two-component system NtrC family sensor kinase
LKSNNYNPGKILGEDAHLLEDGPTIIVRKNRKGDKVLKASMPLSSTDWSLVMIKESFLQERSWEFFQFRLFTIVFVCLVAAVLVAFRLSRGVTAYIRESDIKREQFLAEVEEAEKLASIGRLAAGVAHEINNPLSIINQKAGLVNDYFELTGPFEYKEQMLEALNGIENSVIRCRTITHRLLGFARHADIDLEVIGINKVLHETASFLVREATYDQIQMVFNLQDSISDIYSDRGQLQQVFLNIINNAVDAIGSNGTITLTTSQVDLDYIKVTIADTGGGMSEETRRRIFDPFFTTKETGKGTGLGLSISYGIIEKLGGRISVISEENVGTTFEIYLPVRHEKE